MKAGEAVEVVGDALDEGTLAARACDTWAARAQMLMSPVLSIFAVENQTVTARTTSLDGTFVHELDCCLGASIPASNWSSRSACKWPKARNTVSQHQGLKYINPETTVGKQAMGSYSSGRAIA